MVHPLLVSNGGDNQEEQINTDYTLTLKEELSAGETQTYITDADEVGLKFVSDFYDILDDLDAKQVTTGTITIKTPNHTYTGEVTITSENSASIELDNTSYSIVIYTEEDELTNQTTAYVDVEEVE